MDTAILAYLAGAMDSDGYFTIKRSTYHQRVRGDAVNAVYSERIGIHQVTPDIPQLLRDTFGGSFYLAKPQTPNSKPMYRTTIGDVQAATACAALLPYLRVKRRQAETLIELRQSKEPQFNKVSYWFAMEYPNWQDMGLITAQQAAVMLGYTNKGGISQAIGNGTLLALPYKHDGAERPRIPRLLVDRVVAQQTAKGGRARPVELMAWKERLYQQVRELNKIGVDGTAIYRRDGHYTPAG